MADRRGAYTFLVGKPQDRGHLEDRGVAGRILKWILNIRDGA
jgi:hypothetical protein